MRFIRRHPPAFRDRLDAGHELAELLGDLADENAVVIGLARGGVEVAAPVSRALRLPLDTLAVRKVGHPWFPEYALGAVTPNGVVYLRDRDRLSENAIGAAISVARDHASVLDRRLHGRRPMIEVAGRTCILVDDGLATGATMVAAARWARAAGAVRVIAAVPVGASQSLATVRREVDEVVCPVAVAAFGAVSRWYDSFDQVPDQRVVELIAQSAARLEEASLTGREPSLPRAVPLRSQPPLDPIEQADVDSFPASDPPSWTGAIVASVGPARPTETM